MSGIACLPSRGKRCAGGRAPGRPGVDYTDGKMQNFTLVTGNSYYFFGFLSLMKRRVSSRWDRGSRNEVALFAA